MSSRCWSCLLLGGINIMSTLRRHLQFLGLFRRKAVWPAGSRSLPAGVVKPVFQVFFLSNFFFLLWMQCTSVDNRMLKNMQIHGQGNSSCTVHSKTLQLSNIHMTDSYLNVTSNLNRCKSHIRGHMTTYAHRVGKAQPSHSKRMGLAVQANGMEASINIVIITQ